MNPYLRSKKLWLLAAVLVSALLSHGSGAINEYYLQVILFVGINITLAVSLNLINGYTGQFSLGHAGFMRLALTWPASYPWRSAAARGLLHAISQSVDLGLR